MTIVAVAGGLGPLGRCLVDGLIQRKSDKIYVLSRGPAKSQPPDGVALIQVDYNDVAHLAGILESYGIDTVICALGIYHSSASQAQLNLIQAADASSPIKRFILSSFESLHTEDQISSNPFASHVFDAIAAVRKTSLEFTRVVNGWFLDYYGMPHWPTHLHPWNNIVNVDKKWAVIPGDGTAEANFITTQDLAKFISGLLHLERWEEVTYIAGERVSFNQLLDLAQKSRGCKFEVAFDSLDALKGGRISFPDRFAPTGISDATEHEKFLATLHYEAGVEKFRVPEGHRLNDKLPDIAIIDVRTLLTKCWAGRS